MELHELIRINREGEVKLRFTDTERRRAADIAYWSGLTYLERIERLAYEVNLNGTSARLLLDPIYLTQKSGQELIEEGYIGGVVDPNIRKFLDQVRSLPPIQLYDPQTVSHVSEQLKIPETVAEELLYAQRKSC